MRGEPAGRGRAVPNVPSRGRRPGDATRRGNAGALLGAAVAVHRMRRAGCGSCRERGRSVTRVGNTKEGMRLLAWGSRTTVAADRLSRHGQVHNRRRHHRPHVGVRNWTLVAQKRDPFALRCGLLAKLLLDPSRPLNRADETVRAEPKGVRRDAATAGGARTD